MTQAITPQLRDWIISQAEAGFGADVVLKSMLASGWQEDVAIEAMETTLRAHLQLAQPAQTVAQSAAHLPPMLTVPRLSIEQQPLYLDVGDRRVCVLSAMSEPNIVVIGDFLSAQECDGLIEGAKPRMARSLTVATKTGGEELNADRTSNGMFYARAENELIARVERRLAALCNWPIENGEGLQILHYRPGAEYKPHYDYFDPDEPGTPTILRRGGQRVATIIMYLHEPTQGGGTTFPDVKLEVAPKRGHAVFFSYDRPHPASKSLHGGAPVIEGEKWIATKWLREGKFQ
jgi:prolyl 4-hydroxylase